LCAISKPGLHSRVFFILHPSDFRPSPEASGVRRAQAPQELPLDPSHPSGRAIQKVKGSSKDGPFFFVRFGAGRFEAPTSKEIGSTSAEGAHCWKPADQAGDGREVLVWRILRATESIIQLELEPAMKQQSIRIFMWRQVNSLSANSE
jgi:hypothetical protein